METMYYIGLDVHKRTVSYCVKDGRGVIHGEGTTPATRLDLDRWMKTLPQPWTVALEATVFSGWIYDHLQPHAAALKVAHPLMLRAIAAAKKKNDRIDAKKICDCLRCDFLHGLDGDAYTITAVIKKAGKEVRTVVNAVSKDGKVTTQTAKGTNEQSQPISYTAVWDKQ
jgi:transposase